MRFCVFNVRLIMICLIMTNFISFSIFNFQLFVCPTLKKTFKYPRCAHFESMVTVNVILCEQKETLARKEKRKLCASMRASLEPPWH